MIRRHRSQSRTLFTAISIASAGVIAASCGSDTPVNPVPDPTISLSVAPTGASVDQGGSTTFDATASLGGSFSGTPSIAVTGLPSGVTVTVGSVSASGTTASATVTVDVDASVAPGDYPATVTATGSGVSDDATFTLTVVEVVTGSVSLSAAPDTVTVERGMSGQSTVSITRTDFTDSVSLSAEGVPSEVTASFAPAGTTGDSSVVTFDVAVGATAGTSDVTIRGTSVLPDATTTITLVITDPPPPTSTVVVDYSMCTAVDKPVWVAYADGLAGSWTVATPVADVYTLDGLSTNVVGFTSAFSDGGSSDVSVDYFDLSLLPDTVEACPAASAEKTISGVIANSVGLSNVSLGPTASLVPVDGAFDLNGVIAGPLPFVAYSIDGVGTADRMIIRRDQDIADGGSLGTIDFTSEGFDPLTATVTVNGLLGGETGAFTSQYAMPYATGACAVSSLELGPLSGSSFSAGSATVAEQMAGEFHVAGVSAGTATSARSVQVAAATHADRAITLPDLPSALTVSDVTGGGGYLRLEASFALPSDTDDTVIFDYDGATASMTVAYFGALAAGTFTMTMPDFSGLTGWDDAWAVAPAETGVGYSVGGWSGGPEDVSPLCADGGRTAFSVLTGDFN